MSKFFIFFVFIFSYSFSQSRSVRQLKIVDKKFDSLLIEYQKKTSDSLRFLPKRERKKIMAQQEDQIIKERDQIQFELLDLIKKEEQELMIAGNPQEPEPVYKCSRNDRFEMPAFKSNKSYKPTVSNGNHSEYGGIEKLESLVTFVVTGNGYVENVRATGNNRDFNRDLELTFYKFEKLGIRCENGVGMRSRYRMPVTWTFK